jgi:hypothetical protein
VSQITRHRTVDAVKTESSQAAAPAAHGRTAHQQQQHMATAMLRQRQCVYPAGRATEATAQQALAAARAGQKRPTAGGGAATGLLGLDFGPDGVWARGCRDPSFLRRLLCACGRPAGPVFSVPKFIINKTIEVCSLTTGKLQITDTTTWIWNLHADAHDFDSHTGDLEEISRKVFSAHFGQLSIIFLWLSGMYFHGARFSNYEAWLSDPTHIGPSAQVVPSNKN